MLMLFVNTSNVLPSIIIRLATTGRPAYIPIAEVLYDH